MNDYSLMGKLGEGAFSMVYKVKRKQDNEEYAMKKIRIMSLSEKEVANCLNEVRILASVQSPYVVSYKDSFFDELTNTFCIVTEFLEGGDLFALLNRYKASRKNVPEPMIWQVAWQTLKALELLHKVGVMHRDIKSANIFLTKDSQTVKLGDMNVSIVSSNGMARTQTGTPYYASPEVWNEKPYNSKCDIWSLGCVLYELATLRPPFVSPDLKGLKRTINTGLYKKISPLYSTELEELIKRCLRVDPKDRASAADLLATESLKARMSEKTIPMALVSDNSCKMLDRINAPRKREFKVIKDKLPRNRFNSLERSLADKENLADSTNFDLKDSTKVLVRSNSASSRVPKKDEQKTIPIVIKELPAIPRPKPLRA